MNALPYGLISSWVKVVDLVIIITKELSDTYTKVVSYNRICAIFYK